jgi:cytoskeletal protein CcmA (bactofilin family)
MWRKPEETKPAAPAANVPTPVQTTTPAPVSTPAPVQVAAPRVEPSVRSVAGLTAEVVQPTGGMITSTLLIKGEVRGTDDLYIDGEVRGSIELTNGRVTIGPHGKISADVDAREIVVRGKVSGSLLGRDRVEIGSTGEVNGDISTLRISIGEGAQIHSKVEIDRPDNSKNNNNRPGTKANASVPAMAHAAAVKAGAETGN